MSLVKNVLATKGRDVATIAPDATVAAAAARMTDHRIGALVVLDGDRIVGIFTERDVLNRVVAERKDPAATRVRDVMTRKVAVCSADTTLDGCRSVMTKNKIRHLPVVEGEKLVGMISAGDILARELADSEETIRYLHEYMHGTA